MSATSEISIAANPLRGRRAALVSSARPQITVLGGQLVAGLGNLVVAIALARLLDPGDYADVVAFLALYVLAHVPAMALSAAGALAPHRLAGLGTRIAAAGAAAGAVVVVASGPIAATLSLPVGLVVALGVAAPGAALLGLQRGVAYGHEELGRVTGSLVTEPAVRLAVGVSLALAVGPIGAAVGTVAAGYAALVVCTGGVRPWHVSRRASSLAERPVSAAGAIAVGVSFVTLAVLQATDLLVANRSLDPLAAAQFGVLSTIGGAAFFATATLPLVLMPAAVRGRPHAASTAVAITAAVGVSIAVIGALLARPVLVHVFGPEYQAVAHLVGPYLLAMAVLGVVRIQIARRGSTGGPQVGTVVAVLVAILAEALAIGLWARSVDAVVVTTLFTAAGLAVVLELPHVTRVRTDASIGCVERPDVRSLWAMGGLCAVALLARVATTRGLWVDEAISVDQAQMPFGRMIDDMATTDVHPPLHHSLLWVTVRIFGTSEFAVRLPSLIAGVALVPVMWWVGRVIYDRRTGWVAAILAAIAPFCVWYSQEARMYSLFMLLAAVAVGAQVQAIRRGRTADWVVYGVATALMLWTQYFALLPIAVQQVAFGWVIWRERRRPGRWKSLLKGWALATFIVVIVVLPMLPILQGQLEAYGNRGAGLVPGQAGAGSSAIGGNISIYAVGANLIWALLGYHADGAMVQLAALWPLLMLLALVMLGRGRSGRSLLLLALVVAPMAALFLVGSLKRDLFELRYFSGAVPAMLLLVARVVTSTTRRTLTLVATAGAMTAVMLLGLVDQQVNGANPRLYDFDGAFEKITAEARPGDVVLYEPSYLAEVVDYYAPGIDAEPVGSAIPQGAGVWVLATDRVVDAEDTSARLGTELSELQQQRTLVKSFRLPNVRVWELR